MSNHEMNLYFLVKQISIPKLRIHMKHYYKIVIKVLPLASLILSSICGHGQNESKTDSLPSKTLEQITILGQADKSYLPDIKGVNVFAGKKTNVVDLNNGDANLPQNIGRMIFAKSLVLICGIWMVQVRR
jgi:hypothetical protein